MRVAVVGKGGSGKTTTAAIMARTMARAGRDVVALDCDTNPNLGISLGLDQAAVDGIVSLRDEVDTGDAEHAPSWADLLERFGVEGPDGVRLSVVTELHNPEPG